MYGNRDTSTPEVNDIKSGSVIRHAEALWQEMEEFSEENKSISAKEMLKRAILSFETL